MTNRLVLAALILLSTTHAARAIAEGGCCLPPVAEPAPAPATPPAASAETPAEPGHPLRGVIVAILPEKHALLVKHEEIPDVMGAMTMLLKVDDATLAAAQKGQAITAILVKKSDGWWLQNVKAADATPPAP